MNVDDGSRDHGLDIIEDDHVLELLDETREGKEVVDGSVKVGPNRLTNDEINLPIRGADGRRNDGLKGRDLIKERLIRGKAEYLTELTNKSLDDFVHLLIGDGGMIRETFSVKNEEASSSRDQKGSRRSDFLCFFVSDEEWIVMRTGNKESKVEALFSCGCWIRVPVIGMRHRLGQISLIDVKLSSGRRFWFHHEGHKVFDLRLDDEFNLYVPADSLEEWPQDLFDCGSEREKER